MSGRRYRPPVGLPETDRRRGPWQGVVLSMALHALAVCLLFLPIGATTGRRVDARSLGLPGLVRGGGGGGAVTERLQWLEPAARQTQRPPVPPQQSPVAPPIMTRPNPPPPPTPSGPPDTVAPPSMPARGNTNLSSGTGGPAAGAGTGGGAVGTGAGTGAGTGVGPGATGTPTASKFKAYNTEALPPSLGDPPKDRPFHLVATFEVSERGDGRLLSMTQSKDGGFNKRVREDLETYRFHPATLPNGTAVKDTVQVVFDY